MTPTQLRTLAYCDWILNAPQAHLDLEGPMLPEEIQIGIDHLSEFFAVGGGMEDHPIGAAERKNKREVVKEEETFDMIGVNVYSCLP